MKRPFHVATAAGMFAHHAFELAAGVGLVYQPQLGLRGASALWGAALPGWAVAAARGSEKWDAPLALLAGASVAACALHYMLWPWEFRRGLPTLTEAEGLKPGQLPAYNAVLWLWAVAAATALLRETPRGAGKWAVVGFLATLPQKASAKKHFEWLREEARANPAWWNRAAGQ